MTEKDLHKQICQYIKIQYPNIIFTTDMSGVWLPPKLAREQSKLRSNRGIPDILIFEPKNGYCGLFLELKKESPFRKDGKLKNNKHLKEQNELHKRLWQRGYWCGFVWTFETAKILIDSYLRSEIENLQK